MRYLISAAKIMGKGAMRCLGFLVSARHVSTFALAALVAAYTCTSLGRAYASVTAANMVTYHLSGIPQSGNSAALSLPATGIPVTILGTTKTSSAAVGNQRGAGQLLVNYLDTADSPTPALVYSGFTAWPGSPANGLAVTADVDLVQIGYEVSIRSALDTTTGRVTKIKVHNFNTFGPVSAVLTLKY